MEGCLANLSITFTPNTRQVLAKLQSIIEFLSRNLNNKIASVILAIALLRKTVKKGRLYKEKKWICHIYTNTRKQNATITIPSQSNWNFPDFPPVSLSKPQLLNLTTMMKIEMYYLNRRQRCHFPSWSKKSNICPRHIAGHVPSMALQLTWDHLGPPSFKQLNWRIRGDLSQAINNGSRYNLSLLVSEDAMIVPPTCVYSVLIFTQNTKWETSLLPRVLQIGGWQSHK